jgi:hypothetical protein
VTSRDVAFVSARTVVDMRNPQFELVLHIACFVAKGRAA